jgi:hypothetical protein
VYAEHGLHWRNQLLLLFPCNTLAALQGKVIFMDEGQARKELNDMATAAFQVNINNPDAMQMDNGRFIDMHVNQIKKHSSGSWDNSFANTYLTHLAGMMGR